MSLASWRYSTIERGDGMAVGEFFEDGNVGARAGLGFFDHRQFELLEEHVGKLARGILVEIDAGGDFDAALQIDELLFDFDA